MSKISVVVPVYAGELTLPLLYERLKSSLEPITPDFEILLVDDCSPDRSWPVIVDLVKQDRRVKGIRLSRNFGQHHAITAGLDVAEGDWVVVMDCDLQDEPEEIPRLYAKGLEGYDVVLARRAHRRDGVGKRLFSSLFYALFGYLTDIKWDSRVGVYRIMSRTVVNQLRLMREQLRFLAGLVDWMDFPTATVDVRHSRRHDGKSSYTVRKLFRLAGSAVVAHSDKPLRLAIGLGFAISVLAVGIGTYLVGRSLVYGNPIVGWTSLIVAVYFLGGIVISILGVMGLYLGKVFDEVKRRPLYIVRERVNE